ncbi:MAG: hypothetical protein J6S40_09235 [Thermoguttaceae bacterium]|nr:hypothetical protein [Thermoguttaceae bacterium]
MTKAIVLFSGGLDSLLTTRILQSQGIEVIGLHLGTPFQDISPEAAVWAEKFGIEMVTRRFGAEYLKMLANPHWGYGKAVNPCIDCRIMMIQAAAELMRERGADFVATGEVAGQRPNSQKLHQLELISRKSGIGGKLLRPLTAKTLPPTEMEEAGLVDREKLFSYTGRSRSQLIRRAKTQFDIHPIPQPSTGCLLAEKSFAPRIRDLLKRNPEPSLWDAEALLFGRHLWLDERIKAIVSRRESDGKKTVAHFKRPDRSPSFLMTPENFMGPSVLIVASPGSAPFTDDDYALAGSLMLRYTNPEKVAKIGAPAEANLFRTPGEREIIQISPDERSAAFHLIEE